MRAKCATNIPGAPASHALAILFLPTFEGSLFDVDLLPQLDNIVGELAMQAATRWAERRRSALACSLLVAL
jgi:hypothetical protein